VKGLVEIHIVFGVHEGSLKGLLRLVVIGKLERCATGDCTRS
jgi:hypothetical protein